MSDFQHWNQKGICSLQDEKLLSRHTELIIILTERISNIFFDCITYNRACLGTNISLLNNQTTQARSLINSNLANPVQKHFHPPPLPSILISKSNVIFRVRCQLKRHSTIRSQLYKTLSQRKMTFHTRLQMELRWADVCFQGCVYSRATQAEKETAILLFALAKSK